MADERITMAKLAELQMNKKKQKLVDQRRHESLNAQRNLLGRDHSTHSAAVAYNSNPYGGVSRDTSRGMFSSASKARASSGTVRYGGMDLEEAQAIEQRIGALDAKMKRAAELKDHNRRQTQQSA